MDLVRIILMCLRFDISKRDVANLRERITTWVLEYERLYYCYDLQRLATCTLNIHALLHIPDMILMCGPVWCYWAYVMERFCNSLLQAIRSRRFPFTSLDKRVRDLAQLAQLKTMYGLSKKLDLSTRKTIEETGIHFAEYPNHVALVSRHISISDYVQRCITSHLNVRYSVNMDMMTLPEFEPELVAYGKLQRLEGGDMMHASKIVPPGPHSRDMSWVKYTQKVDIYTRYKNRTPVFVQQDSFGQIQQFLRVRVAPHVAIPELSDGEELLLATIRPCLVTRVDNSGIRYFKKTGGLEVVDVSYIEGVVGRVWDRDCWAIIEREGIFRRIQLSDDEERETEAVSALGA